MDGRLVEVQADAGNGEAKFFLIGLAAASVREVRDRVRSALRNSGLPFPQRRLTVNLAPPEVRKEGSALDVARTAADLDGSDQIREQHVLEALGYRLQDAAA